MENAIHIRIPIERIGALIGPSGRTKKVVENRLTVTVTIDGKTGSVWVAPAINNNDPVTILRARDIVLAVGRGFPPEKAFRLNRHAFSYKHRVLWSS